MTDAVSFAIRPASPTDLPALHALIESAYRGDTARKGWSHEADLLDGQRTDAAALADILADPAQTLLVLPGEAGPVGCVVVNDRGGGLAYLGMLAIDPAQQSRGLGRLLITAAETHARDVRGADRIEMTVIRQRTELIAYYERRGYSRTGEERPFPYGDARFGQPRRDDLAFVVLEKQLPA